MFIKNRRFFKRRRRLFYFFKPRKNQILFLVLKFRINWIKAIFKKLLKLSKRQKVKVFLSFSKNLVISKKSKNSRMGKGKGSNLYKYCFTPNKAFSVDKLSKTRFFKLKNSVNFFLKNKIKIMSTFTIPTTTTLLNTIIIVFFILLGGVIPLIERKVLSLSHRRVGPKFVGFKGRFQFIADAIKLLIKEFILPKNNNKFFFYLLPILLLNLNIFMLFNMVFFKNICILKNEYNLIYIFCVEIINNFLIFFIGFFIKNKYTQISSGRVLNLLFMLEVLVSLFFVLIFFILKSFSISNVNSALNQSFFFLNVPLLLPTLIFIFLIFLKKTPFDLIEAETEIVMGFHVEHCGFLAGALILVEYLHLFFWIFFFLFLLF